jgi:hypothetical protein
VEADLDVLARSKTQLGLSPWQFEGVCSCVVGYGPSIDQLDGHPAVLLQCQVAALAFFLGSLSFLLGSCLSSLFDEFGCLLGYLT